MSTVNRRQPSATRPVPPRIALWGATARRDLPQDFRDGARNCGAPQDERASPVEGRALLLESGLKGTRPTEGGRRHHGSTTSTLVSTGRGRDCMARAARKCSAVSVSACASSGVGSVTATLSAAVRPVHVACAAGQTSSASTPAYTACAAGSITCTPISDARRVPQDRTTVC